MERWQFNSNFLGRFLGERQQLVLNAQGIAFIGDDGHSCLIGWQALDRVPSVWCSLSGGALSFSAKRVHYRFTRLNYLLPLLAGRVVFRWWANAHAVRLSQFVDRIVAVGRERFLRDSTIAQIHQEVNEELSRWKGWRTHAALCELVVSSLEQLEMIGRWKERDITLIRERYVTGQLDRYRAFFDRVESNPLTQKQRIACVTDNNNNLLLAGAGTGKTSVMVGRTGYLVKSAQAKAGEILLLAYGKKAAQEMDERIREKLGFEEVKASTFHSLGLKIIADAEGRVPGLSPLEDDASAKARWVQETLDELMQDPGYCQQLCDYFCDHYFEVNSPFEFVTKGEYLQYINDNDFRSLNNEKLKSHGELLIANTLARKGVRYQYEAPYCHQVGTIEFRQYQPDFYLPDYDIYIEYYGIDAEGNTPSYIDRRRYHEGIEWKRRTHNEFNTCCIELFYYQHAEGKLTDALEKALSKYQVEYDPVADKVLLERLKASGRVTELARLFATFLDIYRASSLEPGAVEQLINRAASPVQIAKAFELFMPLHQRYQCYLKAHEVIDFSEMISRALHYVQSGQFRSPWRYILVDEFQDISEPRARLVRALRDSRSGTSLFCVGDDWQAIYRFSGADVRLTTRFSRYFGAASQTNLDMTFRFNSAIGKVATQFVLQNPVQINKQIESLVQVDAPAVSLLRQKCDKGVASFEPVLNAISMRVQAAGKPERNRVYLLARFWRQLPAPAELQALCRRYPTLNIEAHSFHASKGKEADYVVVTGLERGKQGFPSQKVTPPLIDAFLPQGDGFCHAEERRLFYVALTRARHRVYLLSDMENVSEFVLELLKGAYQIECDEFDVSAIQSRDDALRCNECGTGILQSRRGRYGDYLRCSLAPLCNHSETPCQQCGSAMSRTLREGFQRCINEQCGDIRPLCRECGSEMKLKEGRYGAFWGCTNYRVSGEGCNYSQSCDTIPALSEAKM